MGWMRAHRPTPGAVLGLAALVVALGGAAFAAIPDSDGTIHACYQTNTGNLRVVESNADCRSSERPISWNEKGPPATAGDGRVISNNERLAVGARASGLDVPGFFALTFECPADDQNGGRLTLTNKQTAELTAWIVPEGSNLGFTTIPAGGSLTFGVGPQQGRMFHLAGEGDKAASGPLHVVRGSDCFFAVQMKVNDH